MSDSMLQPTAIDADRVRLAALEIEVAHPHDDIEDRAVAAGAEVAVAIFIPPP